ncbi:hypothetical protein GNI_154930, partial [Gregarina niphandrodes]
MLEQKQARGRVPIEFGSKKMDECQQRWDTRERELYAVRFFVERWQDYFCAAPFTIRTDHQNLLYLARVEGHPGVKRMLRLVTKYFWWPGITKDVEDFCRDCPLCRRLFTAPVAVSKPGTLDRDCFNEL